MAKRGAGKQALTPALSHRMGEGESSSVGRRIQPLWKLRETGLAVPSPVGRGMVLAPNRRDYSAGILACEFGRRLVARRANMARTPS